ncbi:MAG: hypothetical protein ABID54_13195 [Pseudomonadota bacterium]
MPTERKKLAAISAAISAYLREEKETPAIKTPTASSPPSFNVWGLSGRDEMMRMRGLLQRRIFQK